MRRSLILVAAVLLAVPAVAATATPAAGPAAGPPKLAAVLETCTASALPVERIASFVGSMPARAHATRMHMRFDLERRRPGERHWRRLQAKGFGVWERARPDVAGFVFTRRVTGLPVPNSYRALVRFRWLTAGSRTVRRAHLRTTACRQPDMRPNVVPGELTAALDAQPGLAIYTLVVHNAGRSAASPFSVTVGPGSAEVAGLAAGEQRAVTIVAPACIPLLPIVVRVDADRRVEESEERGNGSRRECPLVLG